MRFLYYIILQTGKVNKETYADTLCQKKGKLATERWDQDLSFHGTISYNEKRQKKIIII